MKNEFTRKSCCVLNESEFMMNFKRFKKIAVKAINNRKIILIRIFSGFHFIIIYRQFKMLHTNTKFYFSVSITVTLKNLLTSKSCCEI